MGDDQGAAEGRYADAPVVGLTGARFGGAAGRRLRAEDGAEDGRIVPTHRRRRRLVVGQTGARFGGRARLTAVDPAESVDVDSAERPDAEVAPSGPVPALPTAYPIARIAMPESARRDAARSDEPGAGGADPDWDAPVIEFRRVRPYTWTRGRTAAATDLPIEALVSASADAATDVDASAPPEHHAVLCLCTTPKSVAELAALLAVPLGVARVVLADMADTGIVRVHPTAAGENAPDLALLRRVRDALHHL